jgi:hypothetical protein
MPGIEGERQRSLPGQDALAAAEAEERPLEQRGAGERKETVGVGERRRSAMAMGGVAFFLAPGWEG